MKIIELRNQHMAVERVSPENGQPKAWRLVFTDRQTGDVIWLSFGEETRDELVRGMTGIVVPTARMAIPKNKH